VTSYRWSLFLALFAAAEKCSKEEKGSRDGFKFARPPVLLVEYHHVSIQASKLLVWGLLQPARHKHAEALTRTRGGMKVLRSENRRQRGWGLPDSIEKTLLRAEAGRAGWFFWPTGAGTRSLGSATTLAD